MARIILRILLVAVLFVNMVMIILSYITNINIYKEYGAQILKICGILLLLIIAFYIALGLIGVR